MYEKIEAYIKNIINKKETKLIREDNLVIHAIEDIDGLYADIICFYDCSGGGKLLEWKNIESEIFKKIEYLYKNDEISQKLDNIEIYIAFIINDEDKDMFIEQIYFIERDEMNCRKFVLRKNIIESELLRLPISEIPLREVYLKREMPISARNYLVEIGFNTVLANYLSGLILQDNKKNEIIDYIRKSEFNLKDSLMEKFERKNNDNYRKIKSLEIEGFRAYKSNTKFDLDAELIVIAGPNGLGKTSFFNAIEYVITGNVEKINEQNIINLESKEAIVSAEFYSYGENYIQAIEVDTIKRKLNKDGEKNVFFNDEKLPLNQDKKIMKILTASELEDDRKNRLIQLIRATHFISQAQPELTKTLKINSEISNELMSQMLSIGDYEQVEKNLKKILSEIDGEKEEKEKKKIDYNSELVKISEDIVSIKKDIQEHIDINYNSLYKELLNGLVQENIINNLNEMKYEISSLVEAKARLEDKKNEIKIDIDSLVSDKILMIENEKLKIKMQKQIKNNEEQKNNYSNIDKEYLKLNKEYEILFNQKSAFISNLISLMEQKNKLIEIINKSINLERILNVQNEKQRLLSQFNEEYKNTKNKYLDLHEKHQTIKDEHFLKGKEKSALENEIKNTDDLIFYYKKIKELKIVSSKLCNEIDSLKKKFNTVKIKEEENENKITIISKEIKELNEIFQLNRKNVDEMTDILEKMKKYIFKGKCPVCDIQHENDKVILEIIEKKQSNFPKELLGIENKIFDKTNTLENILREKNITSVEKYNLEKLIENCQIKIESVENEVRDYKNKISVVNSYAEEILNATEIFSSEKEHKIKEIKEIDIVLQRLDSSLKSVLFEIESNNKNLEDLKIKIRETENEILENENKIAIFRKYEDENLIRLEKIVKSDVVRQIADIEENINALKKKEEANNEKFVKNKSGIMILSKKLSFIKENITKVEDIIKNIKIQIAQNESKIIFINNSATVIEEIRDKKNTQIREIIEVEKNLNIILSRLKSEEKEKELIEIKEKKLKIKEKIKEIEDNLKLNKKLKNKVTNMIKEIKNERQVSLKNYCQIISPLIEIINNRLRPTYRFENLTLDTNPKQNVDIKMMYKGNKINPDQFLSEGQLDTLALGVFIASTFTQNWSLLKTVMIDDPIQNLDDLNVYSFLDIIRNIVDNGEKIHRPQIIMSTCDNKVLSLMKRKFNYLEEQGRIKYFIFEGMNENGPVISYGTNLREERKNFNRIKK